MPISREGECQWTGLVPGSKFYVGEEQLEFSYKCYIILNRMTRKK